MSAGNRPEWGNRRRPITDKAARRAPEAENNIFLVHFTSKMRQTEKS